MHTYSCPSCHTTAYFRNLNCNNCGAELAFDPERNMFISGAAVCTNRSLISCNWIAEDEDGYCRSCHMTDVVPDTFKDVNVKLWAEAETSKRWVLINLARWGWFTAADKGRRPKFHLLAESTSRGRDVVMMGHADGLITINVTEADPVVREQRRDDLDERLRTMTAHFRHEIAHFLFDRLKEDPTFHAGFRELFGDETQDYRTALDTYYDVGAPSNFHETYVTRYASAHPHEDWAETTAHMLHLTDILDSAAAFGLQCDGMPRRNYDAYKEPEGEALITQALELGLALNQVNRSMGLQDLYPFVISAIARKKLIFAHKSVSLAIQGLKHHKGGVFGLFH
ncbi:MAG: hypothetical protein CMK09_17305 [Ponticaulis sp.]|nr:hypothetical protein [Ponticaulis sp.]|tara:strand:+ start:24761 stop:25777 length:1017 start_codon:yes stop_codon:yes gene_type:complete